MELQSKVASPEELARWVRASRGLSLSLIEDLSETQLLGKKVATVNPMIWHVGHIAWFQEIWALRHLKGRPPLDPAIDILYDSFEVAHEIRWNLDMPGREETTAYATRVMEQVLESLHEEAPNEKATFFHRLAVFHEDMHIEAMIFDRQTLRYAEPPMLALSSPGSGQVGGKTAGKAGALTGDVEVPGMRGFLLGADPEAPFVFDNEKWGHPVDVKPFRIARAPVTEGEFAEFVESGAYGKPEVWSVRGKLWLSKSKAHHPIYWRRAQGGGWQSRHFRKWLPLREHRPVVHVCWFEAQAYCTWAGRRLPTEAEWELAATAEPSPAGGVAKEKRRYPWGQENPTPELANLSPHHSGTVDVAALPEGDSAFGCRQMLGNVWEWTGDGFFPYPGFVVDPYKEYSAPWFGYHKVLRGGSWATSGRMVRNTWRNFFMPDRRDVFAGFRTCAL